MVFFLASLSFSVVVGVIEEEARGTEEEEEDEEEGADEESESELSESELET